MNERVKYFRFLSIRNLNQKNIQEGHIVASVLTVTEVTVTI
jgi:hypothetical protein